MTSLHPYNLDGYWLKGNLHCHSTESDGLRTPIEVITWYAKHGYDFVTITDHNRLTYLENFDNPPVLCIPGTELTCRRGEQEYHVLGIGLDEMPIKPQADPQDTIDAIARAGGISIIAHPYWHDLQLDDLLPLRGYVGIEIFNNGCWIEVQRGHALSHWDALTSRGLRTWGFAVDDSHWETADFGGGWIVVKSEKPIRDSIIESIKLGNFYSSSGPEIIDINVDGSKLRVSCSPARSIYVFDQYHFSPLSVNAWDNDSWEDGSSKLFDNILKYKPITGGAFDLDPRQEILRIEVVDFQGRSAWSNPYYKNQALNTWE